MRILRAEAMGTCFGVRDALRVLDGVPDPAQVTVRGELVHNPAVLAMLDQRGFRQVPESDRSLPATATVMVTAHGISDRERARLAAADKALLDTTCPLVQKAHAAALALAADGRRVIVLGRRGHVEVRGLLEDLDRPVVVQATADVETWPERRLGVVCQTTTTPEKAQFLLAAIRGCNPAADVRFVDTICQPTKDRGAALSALLPRVDALVVVGGRDSNNTRQLVLRGEAAGVRSLHVEGPDDVDAAWFEGCEVVGLTAGTSTLPATIDAVHARLLELGRSAARGIGPEK